jgi:hypothetical protein
MVRRADIDGYIITAGWYARPASMGTSSPSDGTPSQHRWMHHHRRTIGQDDIDGHIITTGWYVGPTLNGALSLSNDMSI